MKLACDKCKACAHTTSWKSKGKVRVCCHKGNDTSVGCQEFKPKSASVEPAKL